MVNYTDFFTECATGLGLGDWTKHGSVPGIWEYDLSYFMKNKEGIMIQKGRNECTTVASGEVLFEKQRGTIIGWSKNTQTTRDNLYDDTLDALKKRKGFNVLGVKRHDQPREYNFKLEVERLEEN